MLPEYYIRGLNDADARGPFSVEQLASLVESGQINDQTYFYNPDTEQWALITQDAELKSILWPEKKKLAFKAAPEFKAINKPAEAGEKPITVEQFLAAAEGKTEETKGKKDKNLIMMQAAIWGTRAAALTCLVSALALAFPSIDAILAMDVGKLLDRPIIFLGLFDTLLGLLLMLGLIQLYPLVRFRAVFGLGFLGFLFWVNGQPTALMAITAGSAGLYFCTIFLSYIPLIISALVGICGMLLLATQSF